MPSAISSTAPRRHLQPSGQRSGQHVLHAVSNITGTVNGIVNPGYGYHAEGKIAVRIVGWTNQQFVL